MIEVFPYVLLIVSVVANVFLLVWVLSLLADKKYDQRWLQNYRDMLFGENNLPTMMREIRSAKEYAHMASDFTAQINKKIPNKPEIMP